MKIAVIIERFTPELGGAEKSTSELVAEMQSRGHIITILTGRKSKDPQWQKTDMRICPLGMPKGIGRLLFFRAWVGRQLAAGKFDASLSVTSAVPAMAVEPRAGLICEIQARAIAWRPTWWARTLKRLSLATNLRQWMLRWLERKTLNDSRVRHIVCISRMIQDQCLRRKIAPPEKLVHIPNAVKPLQATTQEMRLWRHSLRTQWQVSDSQTVFLFPALDSRRKGLTPLLHALLRIRRHHPDRKILLVLAGKIHPSHQELIRQLHLSDIVKNVGMHKDLRPYYAAADVSILPTYYDTFARVGIESLLLGRPVITTAFDGASEMVELADGQKRGRVVADPDDHAALSQAMLELCNPAERRRCILTTDNIADTYTTARHVDRLLELWKQTL